MAKPKARRREVVAPTPFEQARDELFQHIIQCGVIGANADHQSDWFEETMLYVGGRYHELSHVELRELRTLGERFAQPPKVKEPSSASAA